MVQKRNINNSISMKLHLKDCLFLFSTVALLLVGCDNEPHYSSQAEVLARLAEPSKCTDNEFLALVKKCPEAVNDYVRGEVSYTPLHAAASWGASAKAQALLDVGADVNAETEDCFTPLHLAAYRGHVDVVKLLLAAGADVHAETENGHTALHISAYRGSVDVVKLLLAAGADVNADDAEDDYTPLLLASIAGHAEIAKLLLEAGADVEAELDKDGQTPLWLAALNNHADTIRVLMKAGADSTRACTWYNSTPLMVAARAAKAEAVKALLECGADVNLLTPKPHRQGKPMMTALGEACYWGAGGAGQQHVEIVRLLLAAGANPVMPPESTSVEDQPVCGAYVGGNIELLQILCESGGLRGIEDAVRAITIDKDLADHESLQQKLGCDIPEQPNDIRKREVLLRYLPSE